MSATDTRFSPASFESIIPALCQRDTATVFAWMRENVVSYQSEAQLLETLPRIVATLCRVATEKLTDDPDESWVIERTDGGDGSSTDPATQSVRLIVAALNADDDAITGMVKAVLDHPDDYRAGVAVRLIAAIADFYEMRPKPLVSGLDTPLEPEVDHGPRLRCFCGGEHVTGWCLRDVEGANHG